MIRNARAVWLTALFAMALFSGLIVHLSSQPLITALALGIHTPAALIFAVAKMQDERTNP